MTPIPILQELAIIATLGVVVTVLLARLRLPTVAGLLAAGALLGPHGLALVRDLHSIEVLAEVGVVLLLFTIGLEFSIGRLRNIFRQVALGGLVQVGLTLAATAGIALAFGQTPARAVFYGFVLALSSTAIVLRALGERGELDSPHGRFIVGTLIFQDLCVVPMVLLVPVLGSGQPAAAVATAIGLALGKAALVVTGTLLVARVVVPRVLRFVVASRSREVFLLAILALCVGTAFLTSLAGLSLALGAFLGGLVVADTEYQHRAMGDLIPLRDAFVSVFFISLGMLFEAGTLLHQPATVLLLLVGFTAAKALIATLAAVLMRFPPRAAILAGIGLGQFGEFGFVLMQLGKPAGLTDPTLTAALLSAGILSMFFTPLLIRLAPHLTAGERLLTPLTRLLGVRGVEQIAKAEPLDGHVVVVGFGIAGQLVGQALTTCGHAYCALELNVETVLRAQADGEPVYYADATSAEALDHARIASARAAVVLINDPAAARRVVDTVHRVAPDLPILIRTRYHGDREALLQLGAAEVVAEEVEASVEVLGRLLRRLEVPGNLIEGQLKEARDALHTSDRRVVMPRPVLAEHQALAELKIESLLVTGQSFARGRSPLGLDIRHHTGALVVALRRGSELLTQPDPAEPFLEGDVIYLVGAYEAIRAAIDLLERGRLPGGPAGG
jgi:CPA2 family monovalent cation:H+ antiporter-2